MLSSLFLLAASASASPLVTNVEPPCWWTGMQNDTLQIMVTGNNVGNASVKTDYPGVTLLEDLTLDNPDYKVLYFKISPEAKAGDLPLSFQLGKQKQTVKYPLLSRKKAPEDFEG